jgi:zinc protease
MKRSCLAVVLALAIGCGGARPSVESEAKPAAELPAERFRVESSARPVVELRIVFEAGSADDPRGREGLTALTVATMLEGRAGTLSYAERERRMFPMAAEIRGNVERQQTVFAARVHRDHLAKFYPLLRDVLLSPAFDAADFERIRARSLSALTQELRGADDEQLGKEVLQAMVFEQHPFGFPELGTEHGILASSAHDARAQWERVLCARRVRAVVSGAIDDVTATALRRDLASLAGEACSEAQQVASPVVPKARRLWVVDKPEAQSVAISMGMPLAVNRSHPDYPALMLAAAYFGQHRTFAGRLMQRLRADRGLNYGDYAYAEHFVQDGWSRFPAPNVARQQQYFSMWLRPVPLDKAHFALRMGVRELEMLVQTGLGEDEFARIQRFAERYFALFAQTEQQRLGNLLDDAFYGVEGPHLDKLCAAIRGLTREQVNGAIRRHIHPDQLQIALVAPKASDLVEAIVSATPSPITYPADKPADILAEDKLIEVHPVGVQRSHVRVIPLDQVFR